MWGGLVRMLSPDIAGFGFAAGLGKRLRLDTILGFGKSREIAMIEALKSDEIVDQLGGRFKLAALVQRRWAELLQGARPLIEREGRSDLELAVEEVKRGLITIDFEASPEITPPDQALA